jgi:hypothetical protein
MRLAQQGPRQRATRTGLGRLEQTALFLWTGVLRTGVAACGSVLVPGRFDVRATASFPATCCRATIRWARGDCRNTAARAAADTAGRRHRRVNERCLRRVTPRMSRRMGQLLPACRRKAVQ